MDRPQPTPPGSGGDPLREGLLRLRARWTKVQGARIALQVLFYAFLAGAAVALAFPAVPAAALVGALLVASLVTGLAAAFWGRPEAVALAKEYDDRARLHDLVSSSVELSHRQGGLADALHEDARAAAARLVPAEVVPMRVPREGYWMPVPVLVFAGAVMLSAAWSAEPKRDPRLEQTLEQRLAELESLISEDRSRESERRKALVEELEKLKLKLRPDETEKKDAMEEIAKLREQMEDQREQDEERVRQIKQKLEELTPGQRDTQLEQAMNRGDYSEAMQRLKELQKELEKKLEDQNKELTPEELAELEEILKKLREIEAMLMQLMQIEMDMAMLGDVLEFLEAFDGELADLEDFDPAKVLKLKDLEQPEECKGGT